jgi:hypothetical protein
MYSLFNFLWEDAAAMLSANNHLVFFGIVLLHFPKSAISPEGEFNRRWFIAAIRYKSE